MVLGVQHCPQFSDQLPCPRLKVCRSSFDERESGLVVVGEGDRTPRNMLSAAR